MKTPNKIIWKDEAQSCALVTFDLTAEYQLRAYHEDIPIEGTSLEKMLIEGLPLRIGRILNVLAERNIKATFFMPGAVAERHSDALEKILAAGHETALYGGYEPVNLALHPVAEQAENIAHGAESLKKLSGKSPRGWRMSEGEITADTLKAVRAAGMDWSSSLCDDDRPYVLDFGGSASNDSMNSIIEIPYHYSMAEAPNFIFNFWPPAPYGQGRIANFRKVVTNWEWEFDAFHADGLCCVLRFDPITVGEPGHIAILEKILDHICAAKNIWLPTGSELVDYFCETQEKTLGV